MTDEREQLRQEIETALRDCDLNEAPKLWHNEDAYWEALAKRVVDSAVDRVVAERDRLRRDTEPTLTTVVDTFGGCTDRNPDLCACGRDDSIWCRACTEEIEPGQQAYHLPVKEYVYLSDSHPDQEWSTVWWHKDCDQRDYVAPLVDQVPATEVESNDAPF